jgi:hypothetical protein
MKTRISNNNLPDGSLGMKIKATNWYHNASKKLQGSKVVKHG